MLLPLALPLPAQLVMAPDFALAPVHPNSPVGGVPIDKPHLCIQIDPPAPASPRRGVCQPSQPAARVPTTTYFTQGPSSVMQRIGRYAGFAAAGSLMGAFACGLSSLTSGSALLEGGVRTGVIAGMNAALGGVVLGATWASAGAVARVHVPVENKAVFNVLMASAFPLMIAAGNLGTAVAHASRVIPHVSAMDAFKSALPIPMIFLGGVGASLAIF